mgnify:CR=1 FL=1
MCSSDLGGAGTLAKSFGAIRVGGRISMIGNLSGPATELNPALIMGRRANIQGISVGSTQMFEALNRVVTVAFKFVPFRVGVDEALSGALAPVLDHFDWQPDLAALTPWARWCPDWPGAFDTRFYLADLGTGIDLGRRVDEVGGRCRGGDRRHRSHRPRHGL